MFKNYIYVLLNFSKTPCWILARQRHKNSQSRDARAGALVARQPVLVGHLTGGSRSTPTAHPCPPRWEGCGWLNSTIHTTFFQHGSGAAVLVAVEQGAFSQRVQQCLCLWLLRHTAEPMRISPSIRAEVLTIAVCTHADRAEPASMVSVRTVVIMILDSRRRTSTERKYVKTLTIAVIVRLFEQCYQRGRARV